MGDDGMIPYPINSSKQSILVVGHYCHDCIKLGMKKTHISQSGIEALGGSAAYISNVLDYIGLDINVVAKVGHDFAYSSTVKHKPKSIPGQSTTYFFADYVSSDDRLLKVGGVCEPIFPSDLPSTASFELGLAVGVAGEILPETLEKMLAISTRVIVDLQALIRVVDPDTGMVDLCPLEKTPFYKMLHRVSFLKAAQSESRFMDLDNVRKKTCVIITNGKHGSTVYWKDGEIRVPAFAAKEVDPTGAGDSFLGGFAAGLRKGLSIEKASLLGNYFGALAVSQIGIPELSSIHMQNCIEIIGEDEPSDANYKEAGRCYSILCPSQ